MASCRRLLAEGLDREALRAGKLHRQIAIDDRLADAMAEIAAGRDRDDATLMQDGLAAKDRKRLFQREDCKPATRAVLPDAPQRSTADESFFVSCDSKAKPRLIGVVIRRDVGAP